LYSPPPASPPPPPQPTGYAHPSTTTYVYDALNRLTDTYEGVNGTSFLKHTGVSYDKAGNVVATTDGRGVVTRYTYDLRARRTGVYEDATADPVNFVASRVTLARFDAAGQSVETTTGLTTRPDVVAPLPLHSVSEYDAMGRVTVTYNAVGSIFATET